MKEHFFNIHSGQIVKISTTDSWFVAKLLYATKSTAYTNLGEYPIQSCQLFLEKLANITEKETKDCKLQFGANFHNFIDFLRYKGYGIPFLNIDPFTEGWAINEL